jgi:2,4-dienoyl-CoA reductase-like NADH-dependent reductase (Old Yellow Enzyme family)
MTSIADPFTLPCGLTVPNRLAKAAMTEQLADPKLHLPHEGHQRLYRRWAEGGVGLQVTGNVIVDARHLEHPQNVVLDGEQDEGRMEALKAWAEAAKAGGARCLVQLSHAGRQTPKAVNPAPGAPSAVAVALPGGQFGSPREMTGDELREVVRRFADAARACEKAGFDGVQVHAAHGYLLSSFLNPRANRRTDEWGGSLENRARLLLRVVEAVRERTGRGFALSVKLNSSDFQKGGLTTEDSTTVAGWLAERGVDLLEVSGGSYEQPAMMDMEGMEARYEEAKRESTRAREAYFLDFAEALRARTDLPLMVTGGFRTLAGMDEALSSGATDLIGLARPLCVVPDLPRRLTSGEAEGVPSYEKRLSLGPNSGNDTVRAINGFGVMSFFYENIRLMAAGREPREKMALLPAFVRGQVRAARAAKAARAA